MSHPRSFRPLLITSAISLIVLGCKPTEDDDPQPNNPDPIYLSSITAGQTHGMDVFTPNDSLIWDETYYLGLIPGKPHQFKVKVTPPSSINRANSQIIIWADEGLELGRNQVTFDLGIDTTGPNFSNSSGIWIGSISYDYQCNPQVSDTVILRDFYVFGYGDTIDVMRDWHQPKNRNLIHQAWNSNVPTDQEQWGDTLLFIYGPYNPPPSCGHGIQFTSRGYFMFKVTDGSDTYLGWLKYRLNGGAWPNNGFLVIESWALTSHPIIP